MDVGIIGLGKMGLGMGTRLVRSGHNVKGYDVVDESRLAAEAEGITWVADSEKFGEVLKSPRAIIIMVPAGAAVENAINKVLPGLSDGDVLIDGGNSYYKDSIRHAADLEKNGISFLDAGVSGGVWGLENGFCMMIGGAEDAFRRVEKVFADLAPEGGYEYVGKSGAGHYAKMVHNGIEYGMMEAYGEGFEILRASSYEYDLEAIAKLWDHGSVVRSWLLELLADAFEKDKDLSDIRGWVEDSGEGRWTLMEAIDERVPAPVIALSLMMRFRSRQEDSFSAKVLAALRNQFGGHAVKKK